MKKKKLKKKIKKLESKIKVLENYIDNNYLLEQAPKPGGPPKTISSNWPYMMPAHKLTE